MERRTHNDELVIVRSYFYRHEAEIGRSMLESNGVDAIIRSDDSGGEYPALGVSNGVKLLVRRSDELTARQLLK